MVIYVWIQRRGSNNLIRHKILIDSNKLINSLHLRKFSGKETTKKLNQTEWIVIVIQSIWSPRFEPSQIKYARIDSLKVAVPAVYLKIRLKLTVINLSIFFFAFPFPLSLSGTKKWPNCVINRIFIITSVRFFFVEAILPSTNGANIIWVCVRLLRRRCSWA